MTAETLISGFPMAYFFALTLGALLALLACCRIAELEKAEISRSPPRRRAQGRLRGKPTPGPSVRRMAPEVSGVSGGSGWAGQERAEGDLQDSSGAAPGAADRGRQGDERRT